MFARSTIGITAGGTAQGLLINQNQVLAPGHAGEMLNDAPQGTDRDSAVELGGHLLTRLRAP